MQKKLIALAVAAVISAPAYADVTPYGIIDGAIASISATGQKSDLLAVAGGASTSRLGVKVTEDLGDGLTVVGVLEYALDTETSSGIGNARQEMLALAGGFGTVATGYLQTTGYDFQVKFDPLVGTVASPLQSMNQTKFLIGSIAIAARAPRAIAYISPNLGGVTLAANYTTSFDNNLGDLTLADNATTGLKTTAYLASATYEAGDLAVGAVYAATNNATTNASTATELALGGSYNFGVAKLLATYQSNSFTNVAATAATKGGKAYSVSGVVPVGADAVAVSYAANSYDNNIAGDNGNYNASGYTLGYLHTMSKTTTVYAAYSAVKNGANTSIYSVDNNAIAGSTAANWVSGGGSSTLIGVGLRKKF